MSASQKDSSAVAFVKESWKNTPTRYAVNWNAKVTQGGKTWGVRILNISKGGVLLSLEKNDPFLEDKPTSIVLSFRGATIEITGQLVHHRIANEDQLFGIQFDHLDKFTRERVDEWLNHLKEAQSTKYPKPISYFVSAWKWFHAKILPIFQKIAR